jgi:hypothetical protein
MLQACANEPLHPEARTLNPDSQLLQRSCLLPNQRITAAQQHTNHWSLPCSGPDTFLKAAI